MCNPREPGILVNPENRESAQTRVQNGGGRSLRKTRPTGFWLKKLLAKSQEEASRKAAALGHPTKHEQA